MLIPFLPLSSLLPLPKDIDDDDANDPIEMDRHVLLSCFKLEGILQMRLFNQVLTLVDLRNEVNMDLLRQRIRPPAKPAQSASWKPVVGVPLSRHPSQSIAIGFPPCSPIHTRRFVCTLSM